MNERRTRKAAALAGATLVLTPLISAIQAIVVGWVPANDVATVIARVADTFTTHPPLVGLHSTAGGQSGTVVHHLGPLQFWLLAPFQFVTAPSAAGSLVATALLISCAFAVLLIVAWRRGGLTYLLAATAILALLFHALDPWMLRSPYNPTMGLFGFFGFAGALWGVLNRDWRWLPVVAFFASLVAQVHLTFLFPLAAVLGAAGIIWLRDFREFRAGRGSQPVSRPVVLATIVVGVACWIGPILDEIFGTHNLSQTLWAGSSGTKSSGPRLAYVRLIEHLQIPPKWLFEAFPLKLSLSDNPIHTRPSSWALLSAGFVATAIFASLIRAWRTQNRSLFTLGAICCSSLVGSAITAALLPDTPIARLSPASWMMFWAAGPLVWFFLVLSLVDAIRTRHLPQRALIHSASIGVVCLLVAFSSGRMLVAGSPRNDMGSVAYGPTDVFASHIAGLCKRSSQPIAVQGDEWAAPSVLLGVIGVLRLHGCVVHVDDPTLFDSTYAITGREKVRFLITAEKLDQHNATLIAKFDPQNPPPRWRGYNTGGLLLWQRTFYLYRFTQ